MLTQTNKEEISYTTSLINSQAGFTVLDTNFALHNSNNLFNNHHSNNGNSHHHSHRDQHFILIICHAITQECKLIGSTRMRYNMRTRTDLISKTLMMRIMNSSHSSFQYGAAE